MNVVSKNALRGFWLRHADAERPLLDWFRAAKRARWTSLVEVRRQYPSADGVPPFTVFNIGGNKYRLVVRIDYRYRVVFVRHVLTHAEYCRDDWKEKE